MNEWEQRRFKLVDVDCTCTWLLDFVQRHRAIFILDVTEGHDGS